MDMLTVMLTVYSKFLLDTEGLTMKNSPGNSGSLNYQFFFQLLISNKASSEVVEVSHYIDGEEKF